MVEDEIVGDIRAGEGGYGLSPGEGFCMSKPDGDFGERGSGVL